MWPGERECKCLSLCVCVYSELWQITKRHSRPSRICVSVVDTNTDEKSFEGRHENQIVHNRGQNYRCVSACVLFYNKKSETEICRTMGIERDARYPSLFELDDKWTTSNRVAMIRTFFAYFLCVSFFCTFISLDVFYLLMCSPSGLARRPGEAGRVERRVVWD
jgi:hypothetical protein